MRECVVYADYADPPKRAMGSYNGSVEADLEYPLTFMNSMARVLEETRPKDRPPFRYVQLSGMFVRQDQDAQLWVNEKTRKLKVRKRGSFFFFFPSRYLCLI